MVTEARVRSKIQRYRGGYRSQITHPITGKRLSIVGKTEAEVEQQRAAIRGAALEAQLHVIPEKDAVVKIHAFAKGRPLMVREVWDIHITSLSGDWKSQARATWKHRLGPWFDDCSAVELTEEKLKAWEADQKDALISPVTIRNAFDILAAAFRKQVKKGRLRELPWGDWKPRKPRRDENEREACRSTDELLALLHSAKRRDISSPGWPNVPCPYLTRVALIALLGARQGEAAAWAWDDLETDATGKWVLVVKRQTKRGWREKHPHLDRPPHLPKGQKIRRTAVHETAAQILTLHRQHLTTLGLYRPSGPIFPDREGRFRPNAKLLEPHVLRELWKEAGLPNAHRAVTHSLRHTLGTLEAIAGADVKAIAERLGHSDLKTSLGYLHRTDRGLQQTAIPPIPLFDFSASAELATAGRAPRLSAPLLELPGLPAELAQAAQEELDAQAQGKREEGRAAFVSGARVSFEQAAKEWQNAGCPGVRPEPITRQAEEARTYAYVKTRRKALENGSDLRSAKNAAKTAGQRAKNATIACWVRYAKANNVPVKEQPKQKRKGGRDV